jgi:hypothetical protein
MERLGQTCFSTAYSYLIRRCSKQTSGARAGDSLQGLNYERLRKAEPAPFLLASLLGATIGSAHSKLRDH